MGLMNPLKPASGIYLRYLGGNSCPITATTTRSGSVLGSNNRVRVRVRVRVKDVSFEPLKTILRDRYV
jgi:hypothetical protein